MENSRFKFRAWNKNSKKMLHDILVSKKQIAQASYDRDGIWNLKYLDSPNDAFNYYIPMQYTGLKDKNGVEIYEGDILARVFDDYNEPCIVVYEQGILSAKPISKNSYRPLNTKACKTSCHWCHADGGSSDYDFSVIGNIYENPELLGRK